MGHGHGEGNNCYIKTKSTNVANPREFEVWTNCKKLFGNNSHSLENKPKLFFIQTCRSTGYEYLLASFNSLIHFTFFLIRPTKIFPYIIGNIPGAILTTAEANPVADPPQSIDPEGLQISAEQGAAGTVTEQPASPEPRSAAQLRPVPEPGVQVPAQSQPAEQRGQATVGNPSTQPEVPEALRLPVPETQPPATAMAAAATLCLERETPEEPHRPMQDYMIVYASQPGVIIIHESNILILHHVQKFLFIYNLKFFSGDVSYRYADGSPFIQLFSKRLRDAAYCNDIDKIFKKVVLVYNCCVKQNYK